MDLGKGSKAKDLGKWAQGQARRLLWLPDSLLTVRDGTLTWPGPDITCKAFLKV